MIYAIAEFDHVSETTIKYVAAESYSSHCLVYNGREKFVGVNHVQSVIKFGIDLSPVSAKEVPQAIRLHAEANKWRLEQEAQRD
jgi:hypothetical protein